MKKNGVWIDIKDELPPVGKSVVIIYDCCGEPDVDIMMRQPSDGYENCFVSKRGFLTGDVTHWIPLRPLPDKYEKMLKDKPVCKKCGKSDRMIKHDDGEWVCHHTHVIGESDNVQE